MGLLGGRQGLGELDGVWVQGLGEFAAEGIGKKFDAPAAPMIISAHLMFSSTQLLQNQTEKTNSQV
jgi:hypothetical protein